MKRTVTAALLCCILILSCTLGVSALEPRVVDNAGVLSYDQVTELEHEAASLAVDYGIDVVILITDGLDGVSPQSYAESFYESGGYGMDEKHSGCILLLDVAERHWHIATWGKAIEALTDFGIQDLFSTAAAYFGDDDFFGGFSAYLDSLPYYFDAWMAGDPIDILEGEKDEGRFGFVNITVSLLIGLLIAGLTIHSMKSSMDTTDDQRSASDYLQSDSYDLRQNSDMFLFSNVTKTRRSKDSDEGGGSSTHTSDGGNTCGGGGGSF